MLVKSLLKTKSNNNGANVVTADAETGVAEIAAMFKKRRIGFALLMERGQPVGTVSERDIIHGLAKFGPAIADKAVGDLMSINIVTCQADDTLDTVRTIMTEQRTRHVLVKDGETICGLLSIGDLIKESLSECQVDTGAMREYIAGQGYQ